ncbi:MAG: tyrosine-type recombinase/integrase [Lachnospiraceae bacterium]|nr:tyrosine-type recombinase/integrase [Lachnospiraceae bacterium]
MNKEQFINEVVTAMNDDLDTEKSKKLVNVLSYMLQNIEIKTIGNQLTTELENNHKILNCFFACKRIDGMSYDTEKTYKFDIGKFMDYVNWMPLTKVDTNVIRLFLLHLEQKGNKKTTIDNNRRVLNTFFQWMEDEDYIRKNPCRKIKRIKEKIIVKRYFTELDMERMRDACKNIRELALVDLLVSSGVRVGEIPTIKISEIDWNEGSFIVTGKGNKQRICYMTVRAKKHLQDYLIDREKKGIISDYLFCRMKAPYTKIGKAAIGKVVKLIGERCGIQDIHIHGIRSYFATNLSDKGVPTQVIQALMGHESFSTTSRYYCRPNTKIAREAVLNCA